MWCKCIGVALIAGASAMCFPLQASGQSEIVQPAGTDRPDQQSRRSLFLAQHRPGAFNSRSSIMPDPTTGRKQVDLMFAEATGSFLVVLEIARQQALFEKFGIDLRPVPARGATVPRLSEEVPLGLIGGPAALLQAADGADLRLIATLSTTNLSGHLVARPGIKTAQDLRGKRLGVRVLGAGIWISTVLALEQLGLDPKRDDITLVPVGSPAQILRALEAGEIDGALTAAAQSREFESRGFSVLLRDHPADITSYDGVLVARPEFVATNADMVEKVTTVLIEALAFALAEQNRPEVMRAFKSALNITEATTAAQNLRQLRRKPYPRLDSLKRMQRIMGTHDRRVLDVALERLIDDRFVRALDETGAIGRIYGRYGINTDFGLR
jgi:ABC-type nitrate/sulfonate/bicarbonate transport system substrate-binding protein